jgi:hypothetical protein
MAKMVALMVPLGRLAYKYHMLKRDLCPKCHANPVAVNYIRDGVRHYRNSCASCLRKKSKRPNPPGWARSGYKKKPQCERCSFKLKHPEQSGVFYVDGNLRNNNWVNLKTVCLNCQQEIYKSKLSWKAGPIVPDF